MAEPARRGGGERRLRHDPLAKARPGRETAEVRDLLDKPELLLAARSLVKATVAGAPDVRQEVLESVVHFFVRKAFGELNRDNRS